MGGYNKQQVKAEEGGETWKAMLSALGMAEEGKKQRTPAEKPLPELISLFWG